jgi:endo-1,4-beta-xylanase
VRGHALIFGDQTPGWVKFVIDPNRLIDVMRVHIETVMKHFAGRIVEWDVVNEALDSQGRFRHNVFYDRLGARYVDLAYMFARQADPNAKLFYNDVGAEYLQPKRDAVFNLVRRLHDAGLVDGVGLQAHLDLKTPVTEPQVEQTLRMYQDAGIASEITEMDVTAGDKRVAVADRLLSQAQQYAAVAQACQAVAACERFTVWGVTDKYSWLGADAMPLLFDVNEQPKPAYDAVRTALGH